MNYLKRATRAQTPQSRKLPGTTQVPNSAGGFAWEIDKWARLHRFLILGSEGGSFYVGERNLTFENIECLHECMTEDSARYVAEVVDVSVNGRAPKNDQAIFALAYAIQNGDLDARKLAATSIPAVCRIGTHLFQMLSFLGDQSMNRLLRATVGRWYTEKDADALAYQAVKYRQREGWSHRDVLRKVRPTPPSPAHAEVFGFISGNIDHGQTTNEHGAITRPAATWLQGEGDPVPKMIEGFLKAQQATTPKESARLIAEYNLPREAINTDHLTSNEVWEALLDAGMPMTALIRNLATMTRIGVLTPTSTATGVVLRQLADAEALRKARVHPLAVLIGLRTYHAGRSYRGSNTWVAVPQVVDALDGAFYKAFEYVEPTGKRWLIGIDASGSMTGVCCHGAEMLTVAEAAGAMAMVAMRTESLYEVIGYDVQAYDLGLSAGMRLPDVVRTLGISGSGTDCALPMLYAENMDREVDVFLSITDSETWAGNIHPSEALKRYRRKSGIDAKCVVMGMASNGFSVADPNDAGQLDVAGFDASVPAILAEFAKGSI